jgi:hypothetical protein
MMKNGNADSTQRSEHSEKSDWRNSKEAAEYFGIGRNYLDKIAPEADAKRKIGRRVFYNIKRIEAYIENSK